MMRDLRNSTAFRLGVALVALTLLVRLVPAWLLQAEVADLATYRTQALAVLRSDNIYAYTILFPYTPFSQFVPAWMMQLAQATGWRFDFAAKLPAILGDAITSALLFAYLRHRGTSLARAALWTLAWALNPVAILVSAFHGNMMSLAATLIASALFAADTAET